MSPVMEVLDGRPSSTPNGAPSPNDPPISHLDLGELNPPKGCVSRECTPERASPPASSSPLQPQQQQQQQQQQPGSSPTTRKEDEHAGDSGGEGQLETSPEFQNSMNSNSGPHPEVEDPESNIEEERPSEYPSNHSQLRIDQTDQALSPREDRSLDANEADHEEKEEECDGGAIRGTEVEPKANPLDALLNSIHPSVIGVSQEEGLSQMESGNYTMPPSGVESRSTPATEEELNFSEDQASTGADLSEKSSQHGILSNVSEHQHQILESAAHMSNEELQQHSQLPQQSLIDEQNHHLRHHHLQDPHNPLEEHHQAHLQSQPHPYNDQQQCHMQEYQYPLLKIPPHLQDHMRDHQGHLHDYDDRQHSLGDQRHLQDPLGDHPHHQHHPPTERPHGYWNMHLGMLSKVKTEAKDWYEREGMVSEVLGNSGLLKSEPHDIYGSYRIPSHPSLGSESPINGPRPSPIPHGGIPFSQSPDQRQHQQPQHPHYHQPYQNHSGMRDMSPLSPKFQGHPRGHLQTSQHHGASQLPPGHPGAQHPGLQHPSQHHPANQHLQQQYGHQQYGGQQQLALQAHHGQQLPSPYTQGLMPGMGGPGHRPHDGREGREGDPYSFVDEYTGPPPRPVEEILGHAQPKRRGRKPKHIKLMENGGDPLAIAAAQAAHEAKKRKWRQMGPDGKPLPLPVKPRKRIDRFDGISEDELSKKILPDHLGPNLDIVIIGINPGLFAAYKGHHYAGPGNHFWKCLFLSGLIPEPLTSDDDHQLLDHGIGFTNIVARTTRGSAELTRKEIKEGGQILLAKLQRFQPRVAVFNGKGIYEIFSGKKEFTFGRQPEKIEGTHTHVWVMPSSSARCAQLPRALDKVPFYTALRKFRDFLKGTITELTEEEVTFSCPKTNRQKMEEIVMEDEFPEPFLEDSLKDDLESSRFESELDSEEISRSISQSLYNLSGMTREQLEALDCPTIPIRKKRGRPKKAPDDPNAPPRPKPRSFPTELMLCNGEEPPRKKRGRPKKVLEDGTIPPPKRPGRKPKALKEMLAAQQGQLGGHGIPQNPHSQMGMGHLNGMMSPTGFNSNPNGPPFSPQFGGPQVHPLNGPPSHPGDLLPSVHGTPNSSHGIGLGGGGGGGGGGTHNSMHGALGPTGMSSIHSSQGCSTPNSSSGAHTPVHNSLPPRGQTPQQSFGQSPGYSPSPVPSNHLHTLTNYSSHPLEEKSSDLQQLEEEERQLGISPIPPSPGLAQPDFEPPTSLPEGEPLIGEGGRSLSAQQHPQEDPTPSSSIPSQFSNPATPADESATSYQNFSSYPPVTSCSPTYNTNVVPSPSYQPPSSAGVSHSPSYPASVSCSPSYTHHNTHSPSYPPNSTTTHSPSYHQSPSYPPPPPPPHSTQSPSSYPRNATQSPSYLPPSSNPSRSPSYPPPPPNQSPSFPSAVSQSPSYPSNSPNSYHPNITHSPSYSTLTRSPSSYPTSNLSTQSPSYAAHNSTNTHSPSYSNQSPSSYRPPTSNSPASSFSPSINNSNNNNNNNSSNNSNSSNSNNNNNNNNNNTTNTNNNSKPLVVPPGVHSPQLKSDVSSKSLSGLESLVDQIPSLNDTTGAESTTGAAWGSLANGPTCSNPTTPAPSNDPFSPGHGGGPPQNSSSFQSFAGGGGGGGGGPFPSSHYGSPQPANNPYSPQFTSSSTNLSTNFSVSSLASSSCTTSSSSTTSSLTSSSSSSSSTSHNTYDAGSSSSSSSSSTTTASSCNTAVSTTSSSSSFSVSSLTGGSPTPTPMYNNSNSYSPVPPGPSPHSYEVMGSSILPPTPPMGPSSFMGSGSSMGGSMGSLPTSMNMSGYQLPYHNPQYGESSPGGYNGPPGHSSFPYGSSSPGFHVPSPRFSYPSPYAGSPYSQGYSQNAMLERIKQTGMGFGSF